MDVSELVGLGGQIVEIGTRLKVLRKKRDEVNAEISSLEDNLKPLVVQHAQIIAETIGAPIASIASPQAGFLQPDTPQSLEPPPDIKKRVLMFLQNNAERGASPLDIAEALKLDVMDVRGVMRELASSGR